MSEPIDATDNTLNQMLAAENLPKKASYTREEVCRILRVSPRTFWTMVSAYEPNGPGGCGADPSSHPATLDSFMLRGHRRVPYHELLAFLRRNRTYERLHDPDPHQLTLPGFGS
jgi:hypothetical protein